MLPLQLQVPLNEEFALAKTTKTKKTGAEETAPVFLMEDHRDAYFTWKKLGLSGGCCVHVDAHLDLCDFKVPGYTGLAQPEVNCGNYLLPAFEEELVKELVWVVPPHLKKSQNLLTWTREELQRWVKLRVDDYMSLTLLEGRVEGTLLGRRLVVCESHNLPTIELPVFLDIDVDYYLGPDDEIWQQPAQLLEHLSELDPLVVTIAYSVAGGYTPLPARHLGPLTELFFNQDPQAAEYAHLAEQPQSAEREDLPGWLRAAALLSRFQPRPSEPEPRSDSETRPETEPAGEAEQSEPGQAEDDTQANDPEQPDPIQREDEYRQACERAAGLDPGFTLKPMDRACGHLMREKFELAVPWMETMEDQVAADYLLGFTAFRKRDDEEAVARWSKILDTDIDRATRRHLLELMGRAEGRRKRYKEAAELIQAAIKLDRRDSLLWLELARLQSDAEEFDKSARSYRKVISIAPGYLTTLEAELELALVYQKTDQPGLAQAQCRRVLNAETPDFMKLKAEMVRLKLAARKKR